jgi:hypothetical protein
LRSHGGEFRTHRHERVLRAFIPGLVALVEGGHLIGVVPIESIERGQVQVHQRGIEFDFDVAKDVLFNIEDDPDFDDLIHALKIGQQVDWVDV